MRYLQVILFFIAALVFIISLFFIGTVMGDVLWRAGMAILLFDIVCIMLWTKKSKD
jgi:hypothetical protein